MPFAIAQNADMACQRKEDDERRTSVGQRALGVRDIGSSRSDPVEEADERSVVTVAHDSTFEAAPGFNGIARAGESVPVAECRAKVISFISEQRTPTGRRSCWCQRRLEGVPSTLSRVGCPACVLPTTVLAARKWPHPS